MLLSPNTLNPVASEILNGINKGSLALSNIYKELKQVYEALLETAKFILRYILSSFPFQKKKFFYKNLSVQSLNCF